MLGCQRHEGVSPPSDPEGAGGLRSGSSVAASRQEAEPDVPRVEPKVSPDPAIEVVEAGQGSMRLLRSTTIHAEPSQASVALGVLAGGTRIRPGARFETDDCPQGWVGLPERGWVCGDLQADDRAPTQIMLPQLPGGARVPGVYGRVTKSARIYDDLELAMLGIGGKVPEAALTVQRRGVVRKGGKTFWKTRHGLIESKHIRRLRASGFQGEAVGTGEDALQLPIAWTLAGRERRSVPVRRQAAAHSKVLRRASPHEAFSVQEVSEDGSFVNIGEGWIAREHLRIAEASERPEAVNDGERWIDIDLEQQTLVAYEGDTPVYATLVSTGRARHRTPTGVYRIERKIAQRTMNSMADSDETYSVEKVPWTAYFDTGYALHAAYWHNGFGRERSHGCINLSPADAQHLYGFTGPAVQPGWSEVYGHAIQPGSVVRIRSRRDPEPQLRGYAAAMAEPKTGAGTVALAAP